MRFHVEQNSGQESKEYSRIPPIWQTHFDTFVNWTNYHYKLSIKLLSGTKNLTAYITKKEKKNQREAAHGHLSTEKYRHLTLVFKKMPTDQLMQIKMNCV